jgi:hypothetical protein
MKILISGSAGHYPYLLGIARGLQIKNNNTDRPSEYFENIETCKKFDLNKVKEIHAYSSGCVVALMLSLNIDINYAMNSLHLNILDELNKSVFGSAFNFLKILKKELLLFLDSLSKDIFKKANNKLFIHISYFENWGLSSEVISNFHSNEDLVDCCIASGFIPIYGKSVLFLYRNKYCIDYALKYTPPVTVKYNFRRDAVRDLNKMFGSYVFISSNYNKVKDMYELGIRDSDLCHTHFKIL